jgi:multicomponent Na+:H+ antiporter subunit C
VTPLLAMLIGVLYAAGIYMLLRRSVVKLILGLVLLSHAAHLLIFTAGGLQWRKAPFIPPGAERLSQAAADPLPQALILTAIVISFGLTAFALVLVYRAYQAAGTDDWDEMRSSEP